MVWDLGRAMFKKQEFECARLMDFEFRLRARTMRSLAKVLGLPATDLVERIALAPDEAILAEVASQRDGSGEQIDALYHRLRGAAREELIGEIGDPAPCRLG